MEGRRSFGILGPVEALAGDQAIDLGGSKQRALLAVLLLLSGEVVSADRLVAELWGPEPPTTAPKMLQVLVSRLRRAIEPEAKEFSVLVTRPGGYAMVIDRDQLDLEAVRLRVELARKAAPIDPAGAAAELAAALELWRGEPLSDVADEPFAAWAVPRLDELRASVSEERIDLALRAGLHAELIGELRDLVARYPFRERIAAQLMLALYRTGRQAEALDAYRALRGRLDEQLGIEPATEVERLQLAILRQDPELELPPSPAAGASGGPDSGDIANGVAAPAVGNTDRSWIGRRRQTAIVAALAIVLVGSAVIGWRLRNANAGGDVVAADNSVAVLDLGSGGLVADIPAGNAPGSIAISGNDVWVGSTSDDTILRLDLAGRRVVRTTGLASAPSALVVSGGNVWIADGFTGLLSRILVAYDQLSAPFYPDRPVSGLVAMAARGNDLWVGLGDGSLLRLDAASLHVLASANIPERVLAIGLDSSGSAWTIPFKGGLVHRVDAATGAVDAGSPVTGAPVAIAATDAAIWVATSSPNRLWKLDPSSGAVASSVDLQETPTAVVANGTGVWVLDGPRGQIERLDPSGVALPVTIRVGNPVGDFALADGQLVMTIR